MPDHRVYPLRKSRNFEPPEVFVAKNDAEAFVNAEGLDLLFGYEIWNGARLVAVVQRRRRPSNHFQALAG
jgi:hypothetical protein